MTTLTYKRGDTWPERFYCYDDADGVRHLVRAPLADALPTGTAVNLTTAEARLQIRDSANALIYECDLTDDLALTATPTDGIINWAADYASTELIAPTPGSIRYSADLEVTIGDERLSTDTFNIKVLADVTYTDV